MIDPEALERKQKIKEMEKDLNNDEFESVQLSVNIQFEDRETDMTEFNEYLMKGFPYKEVQATAEVIDSQTQYFQVQLCNKGVQTTPYVSGAELVNIAKKLRAVDFSF